MSRIISLKPIHHTPFQNIKITPIYPSKFFADAVLKGSLSLYKGVEIVLEAKYNNNNILL